MAPKDSFSDITAGVLEVQDCDLVGFFIFKDKYVRAQGQHDFIWFGELEKFSVIDSDIYSLPSISNQRCQQLIFRLKHSIDTYKVSMHMSVAY